MAAKRCPMCHTVNEDRDWQCQRCHYEFGQPVERTRELLRVYSLLDGRIRLGDLAARVRSPEARTNLLRLTYLLVQTELARLS